MPLKVVISGAYSTGKTTLFRSLARALRRRGKVVVLIPDLARLSPVELNERQTENGSLWLLMTQIARELSAERPGTDIVLCDRGVPDVLAHSEELIAPTPTNRVLLMKPFLQEWMKSYDIVLLSRLNHALPIVKDGVRSPSSEYRATLDVLAEKVLSGVSATRVLPNESERRLRYALEAIREKLPFPD